MGKISPFEILGETFTNAYRFARYFLPVALVTAIFTAVLNAYFLAPMTAHLKTPTAMLQETFWSTWAIVMLATTAVQMVQLSLFDAAMERREKWFRFGMMRAVRRVLPALIGMAVYLLAYMAGFILLVIPGLMVVFLLYMMLPLIVLDDVGPFAAVKKSWQLTWGNAWRLFGAILVMFLPIMLVIWPVGIALGYLGTDPQQFATLSVPTLSDWQAWVWILLTAIIGMLATSFFVVTFRALKAAKAHGAGSVPDAVSA